MSTVDPTQEEYSPSPRHSLQCDDAESGLDRRRLTPLSKLCGSVSKKINPVSEYLAECLGTMIIVTIGGASVAQNNYGTPKDNSPSFLSLADSGSPGYKATLPASNINVHLAWGLAVMLGIFISQNKSLSHLNPAVTLSNCLMGNIPWKKGFFYILSQFLGGFLGGFAVYMVYYGAYNVEKSLVDSHVKSFVSNVATGPLYPDGESYWGNALPYLINEVTATAILLLAIYSISDSLKRSKQLATTLGPLLTGLSVTAIGTSFCLLTGYAINPARDFGPRLAAFLLEPSASNLFVSNSYFLIPLFAPVIGAVVGTFIYYSILYSH